MLRIRSIVAIAAITVAALLTSTEDAAAGNPCCCPPAPIQATLCVNPPCSCCAQNVSVCIPGCCTGTPTVCWRRGFLGRQIGTYTWPCCGHSVKVVVTRRGAVKVHG